MSRIRTVKPELSRHEGLFDLEQSTGMPVRFVWAMLPTACDREGRFKWKLRALKTEVVPFDDLDFGAMMADLGRAGQVHCYRVDGEWYGLIPTWRRHQVPNHRERASEIPGPELADATYSFTKQEVIDAWPTRAPRVDHDDDDACPTRGEDTDHACPTRPGHARGDRDREGKGRERNKARVPANGSTGQILYPDRFESFKEAWPADAWVSESDVIREWNRLRPTGATCAAIVAGVRAWSACPQWQEPRFIPHPSRWLAKRRWEDPIPGAAADGPLTVHRLKSMPHEEFATLCDALEVPRDGETDAELFAAVIARMEQPG